ncbi:MAG TPA: hypothetical protein VFN67_09130 [Polyangiales bacterium]|nr:hypothetical protein [Polyangiales bacterium]
MTPPSDPDDLADSDDASPMPVEAAEQESADVSSSERATTRWLLAILRYAAPAFAAIALMLVMAAGGTDLNDDLQVFVPLELPISATRLPVRGLRYGHLLAIDGPVLQREAVPVEAVTAHETLKGTLQPTPQGLLDLEANLALPPLRAGDWIQVHARANDDTPPLEVYAHVQIKEQLEREIPQGRALRALQQYAPGAVQAEPSAIAPDALVLRVRGGACVPEETCKLALQIGSPQASVQVQANSTLSPSPEAVRGSAETNGVVLFDVTTHGPEAELWLNADRGGKRVARRAVRLPIAMGALSVGINARVVNHARELKVFSPAAVSGCIVDAYQDGRWRETGSLAACDKPATLTLELGPGLWRLQLRRDAFATETAGVASVYIRGANEPAEHVASQWARAAVQLAPDDKLAIQCVSHPELCTDENAIEYLAATADIGLLALPRPVTSYAARLERAREQTTRMRWLALGALCLGAVGLVLSVGRSGVSAGVRASLLFLDDPRAARRARLRSMLLTAASAVSLLMVFAVLALYVLARGGY